MMIDNDDVGFLRTAAHAGDEALVVVRTLLAETGFGARIDVTPEGKRLRQIGKLSPIASFTFT
jgi:hypothetical protein